MVVAALIIKEAVLCSNMILEPDFKGGFGSVSLYIDTTSAFHVAGNRTYSPRAQHIALRHFFVQELVEEGKITIHIVKKQDRITDLATKHANKYRHRTLIKFIRYSRRKRQGDGVRRGRTRLYVGL